MEWGSGVSLHGSNPEPLKRCGLEPSRSADNASRPPQARRRIEAAEQLLGFEAPPEAVGHAREYLVAVFEDSEQAIPDRMDALKVVRKFEAAKVALPTVRTARHDADRREAWRRYEISQRHWKLSLAIHDTPPPGWADDLYSDDYQAPKMAGRRGANMRPA